MKYVRQTQNALDKLDQSLLALRGLIKRGKNEEALQYMENGGLKESFEDLQNIIIISSTNTLGARGTNNSPGMF